MRRTNIYLDEDQLRGLKHLAAEEGQTVAELVRQAVDSYLARRFSADAGRLQRFNGLLERIRTRVPAHIPPQEIEADVTAAREEVRQAHRAARRH